MSSQIVPIHRTNQNSGDATNKNDVWFNAFNYAPGEDQNIRWLSRPNQQLYKDKHDHDAEKFRITFDVENFQPEQIKIYIQNRKLTISGVYEERSDGRYMQKQFERTFDIPPNAEVDSMASFITAAHMLVVEIPINTSAQIDHLSINDGANNQRRLSFSLNKYNTSNNEGLLSSSNDSTNLSAPGQQVRRTSITKTTTTTTTGSSGLPSEATELLRSSDNSTGSSSQTYSTHTTERRSSNAGNQQIARPDSNSSSSTTTSKQTTLTSSDLANLPIEIPPELLASGGTITIQKRKVSVTKGTDAYPDGSVPSSSSSQSTERHSTSSTTTSSTQNTDQSTSVPIKRNNEQNSTQSTTSTTTTSPHNTDQSGVVPIKRSDDSQLTTSNTSNQNQSSTSERRGSRTSSSTNSSSMFTLEEFLQNKTWNPSLVDGPNGKKILYMRLQMKPGTKSDQMKISLNGYDLRIDVNNKVSADGGRYMSEQSYRQVTLFPTCEVDQLKTELKDDGYLHIQVPIKL